jgi:hypothetical protein
VSASRIHSQVYIRCWQATASHRIGVGRATAVSGAIGIILNLILPKESEGLTIDAPAFDAEFRAEAAKEATAEA